MKALLEGKRIDKLETGFAEYPAPASGEEPLTVDEFYLSIGDYEMSIASDVGLVDMETMDECVGQTIVSIEEQQDYIQVQLEKGGFVIYLGKQSHAGPESLSLQGPDDLMMIWD